MYVASLLGKCAKYGIYIMFYDILFDPLCLPHCGPHCEARVHEEEVPMHLKMEPT